MADSTIAAREFTYVGSRTPAPSSASIRHVHSSTKSSAHQIGVPGTQTSRTLRTAAQTAAAVLAGQGGLPSQVRFKTQVCLPMAVVQDLSTEMQSNEGVEISEVADFHSLLSTVLEQMVDRMRGTSLRSDDPSKQTLKIVEVEIISRIEPLVRSPVEPVATMRVGSLELDLINHTARRGDRSFDLRPREFRLLKYMMQRRGQLLTRANLFEDVWNYKFTPKTNLVDVQLGQLRRKVDAPNETPMIHNVRGAAFILSATE
jgi:DNA-binding response OmpR family regulator